MEVGHGDGDVRVARERRDTGQAVEGDTRQRVLIRATVDRAALDLLGRDVVEGAHERAGLRQAGLAAPMLGQAEVGQIGVIGLLDAATGRDQDVRRLHVPVDEPGLSGGVERARPLAEQSDGLRRLERSRSRGGVSRSAPSTKRMARK